MVVVSRSRHSTEPADPALASYIAKRDFDQTAEPRGIPAQHPSDAPIFVVQKHSAQRAGLHYDFRLERNGVLMSWAVPKGPSLDPTQKRMAIHVEDHPLDYAGFAGEIETGYGAGHVEVWDHGTWEPVHDIEAGLQKGHLLFTLRGTRLRGEFSLVRLPKRGRSKQEAWLLIKADDDQARPGGHASALESSPSPIDSNTPPAPGAVRATLPHSQKPQLCEPRDTPPKGDDWLSELKFDGYRLIARVENGQVALLTREGHDWTSRMPRLARDFSRLKLQSAMLDGELVVLRDDGVSDFGGLQAALSEGRDQDLLFYAFDLLHLNGWDLRGCELLQRKTILRGLCAWQAALRYSDHHEGDAGEVLHLAAARGLEGIVMKRRGSKYRAGRSGDWVKVKILGRQEFVILGWSPPAGQRTGFGALQLGYYDDAGFLHDAGGVGTGFSDRVLTSLRARLDQLTQPQPHDLVRDGEPIPRTIRWVRPELVAEISFTSWSNAGRLRHAVFVGLREDKAAHDVRREKPPLVAPTSEPIPPTEPAKAPVRTSRIVHATAPKSAAVSIGGVAISHASREIWPGFTKQNLAEYWQSVAEFALPGIAARPLAVLRCPDGIDGEQFFQKHRGGFMPEQIRDGVSNKQPYLAIDDVQGLIAFAQMSAVELHCWGATEADPLHPDRLVFDLDPGEGVAWSDVIQAAHDMRERLKRVQLESFCRTSGGKGLHVVVPLTPTADWPSAKAFCRTFAEVLSDEEPKRFLAHTKIADRKGRILIDWLRNGPGATAIASFSPRARPGATVATPLAWREVTERLDPKSFTIATIPKRLGSQRQDPWAAFAASAQPLPTEQPATKAPPSPPKPSGGTSRIVVASKPKRK